MSNFKPGGQKRRPEFIGGRPKSEGPYKPKKSFEPRGGSRFESRRSDSRPSSDTPLHKATCTTCGKPCEVPFRPDGTKPVLCRDCFAAKNAAPSNGNDRRGGYEQTERKPERERSFAPVPPQPNYELQNLSKQIAALEEKMTRLLDMHEAKHEVLAAPVEVSEAEVGEVKVRKPRKVATKKVAKATKAIKKVAKKAKK